MLSYTITPLPLRHLFQVALTYQHTSNIPPKLSLPNWTPGSYMIREFARHIVHIEASCNNQPITLQQINKNTWQADESAHGNWQISYTVYAFDHSVRGCYLDHERGFIHGAALFLLPRSDTQSSCQVSIRLPENWQIATTLPKISEHTYQASHHRALIDYPIEIGAHIEWLEFEANNIPHRIALSGHYPDFNRQRLIDDVAAICHYEIALFGSAPFSEYCFLLHVGEEIYGGLEHHNSTALLANRRCLPSHTMQSPSDDYIQLLGLISHEYFHAWNVKTIRPKAVAESNLDQEAYFLDLWAYEGITSYYDDLILARSQVISQAQYLKLLQKLIEKVAQSRGHQEQTLANSSLTAWSRYYKPNENSANAATSYYQQGALLALCLDGYLKQRQSSLDKLMRALYHHAQQSQEALSQADWYALAAAECGTDVVDFIEHAIHTPTLPPLATYLPEMGLTLSWSNSNNDTPNELGAHFSQNANDITLSHVASYSSAELAGLCAGDRLIALNQIAISNFAEQWRRYPIGEPINCHYFRQGILHHTTLIPTPNPSHYPKLEIAEPELFDAWLTPNK